MAKQVDSSNIGTLLQGVFTKIKNAFWGKDETSQLAIDSVPTRGSNNLVKSGGVYSAIPDVSQFITRSVNDLANYYLKSETYTKDEVAALIGAIQKFHYEIYASRQDVVSPANNVLYLIGPTGSGADKYEEYVYSNGWVKIGDTSIDLSGLVTTEALNVALAAYTTSADLATLLAAKQDMIADLADIRRGASAGATAYQKPQAGIPAADLADKYAGSPSAGGPAFKALGIPFGSVDSDSTATDIKATVDNFPETLTAGVCAYIRNDVVASASGFTLNVNGTGALPVYQTLSDASRSTTVFNAASTYLFVYNPTRVEGGCWDLYYGYNSNDNTIGYILRTNYMSMPVTSACYRYRLLFTSANGQGFVPANASTSTNATAKRNTTQTPIDPFGSIHYYNYTSAVSSGARPGATYLCEQYQITLGYSFNRTGAALELTAWDPVYIKCAPQADGSAIIDEETPYVQALPSTEDGKIYIFLGVATSATQVELVFHHPVYYFKDGAIRLWTNAVAGVTDAVKYTTQTLTDAQKAQARNNIGASADKTLILSDVPAEGDYDIPSGGVWPYGDTFELEDAFQGKYDFVYIYKEGYCDDVSGINYFAEYTLSPIILQTSPEDGSGALYFEVLDSISAKTVICYIWRAPTGYITVSHEDSAPTISTDVAADKTSTTKVSCPKSVYDEVHPAVQSTQPQGGFLPNIEYNLGTLTGNVTFALASAVSGITNHYFWTFMTGSTAPSITWPSGIAWNGGSAPTINAQKYYEISILNNRAVWIETDVLGGIQDDPDI